MYRLIVLIGFSILYSTSTAEFTAQNMRKLTSRFSDSTSIEVWNQFVNFVDKYRRTYSDQQEVEQRFNNFRQNLERIERLQNEQLGTATFAVNTFADLSEEEFRQQYNSYRLPLSAEDRIELTEEELDEFAKFKPPPSMSWRDRGAITRVKNQGPCGSCFAFAALAALEAQHEIKHGRLIDLSVEQILDCRNANSTCGDGGTEVEVYKLVKKMGGVMDWNSYPYAKKNVTTGCKINRKAYRAHVKSYVNYTPNMENEMVKWLAKDGPLAVGINSNSIEAYSGGLYRPSNNSVIIDHAVLITGYGITIDGTPYWEFKNSWGSEWGEGGYMRLIRGENALGIASEPNRPISA